MAKRAGEDAPPFPAAEQREIEDQTGVWNKLKPDEGAKHQDDANPDAGHIRGRKHRFESHDPQLPRVLGYAASLSIVNITGIHLS